MNHIFTFEFIHWSNIVILDKNLKNIFFYHVIHILMQTIGY